MNISERTIIKLIDIVLVLLIILCLYLVYMSYWWMIIPVTIMITTYILSD